MCSKSQQAPASRTLVTFTSAAAAAAAAALMAAAAASSSSAVPILGVEAFSPTSPFMPSNHRFLLNNQRVVHVSSCQRINNSVKLYAAEAEAKDDDESESESKSDGDSPAPAPTPAAAEDEVSCQLAKAKELIERTKQKMESKEKAAAAAAADQAEEDADTDEAISSADEDDEVVPFFAVDPTAAEKRRQMVTKTKDEESGLITTDGEKMASLADGEKWESRGLDDLFENEIEEDEAAKAKEARASRDVARSMMNLKMIMNKNDFDFIFDKKNRFIGEE